MVSRHNPIKVINTESVTLIKETHNLKINDKEYRYTDYVSEEGVFTDWSFQDGDGKFIIVEPEMEPIIIAIQNTVDEHLNRSPRHNKIVEFTDSTEDSKTSEESSET